MLILYILLLAALAAFTAYTRNFQRTIVTLGNQVDATLTTRLIPRAQWLRTLGVMAGWAAALGLGAAFIAWWKAVVLVVGAFIVLVPVLGSLTPRAMAPHYLTQIRADLQHRVAQGGADAGRLRRVLTHLDQLGAPH
jgi:hypothetical protein